MTAGPPTADERERAAWEQLQLQIETLRRQIRWEMPRAVAMIILALAAMIAAARLPDLVYPPRPQVLTVHLDQPITVRLEKAP